MSADNTDEVDLVKEIGLDEGIGDGRTVKYDLGALISLLLGIPTERIDIYDKLCKSKGKFINFKNNNNFYIVNDY